MNYIVLDIETTGLSKYKHKITEIAAIKFDGKNILGEFETLVNPERNIPTEITRLTGISNEMVENAPKFFEIIPNFLNFIKDDIIVAHNASFDYGFISENIYANTNKWIQNECICTRKLANRLLPELPKKNLGTICEYMGIKNEAKHRAMGDTKATVQVFGNLLDLLKRKGITGSTDIINFQNKCLKDII